MESLIKQIHQLREDCEIIITSLQYIENYRTKNCSAEMLKKEDPDPEGGVEHEEKPVPKTGQESQQAGTAKTEKKPVKTVKVDKGRIIALAKAGWKRKDIAEDAKCSEATVYAVLKEARG